MIHKPRDYMLLICLCLLVAGACGGLAAAALEAHLVVPAPYLVISADERAAGDLLLLTALAAFFDADVRVVVPLYPAWSIHDIVLILAIHHGSHRDLSNIIALRKRHGWGWGEIAHRLGVHPGLFNKQRVWAKKQDKGVGENLLVRAIAGYWGLPPAHVKALRGHNYPAREIALAANTAARSGKPLGDVLAARAAKKSWKKVAARHGVNWRELSKPVQAKGRFGKPPTKAASDKGSAAKTTGKSKQLGKGGGKGKEPK